MPDICSYIFVTSNWKVELKQRSNRCCCSCLAGRHVSSLLMSEIGVSHHFDWERCCTSKSMLYFSRSLQHTFLFTISSLCTSLVGTKMLRYFSCTVTKWSANMVCQWTTVEYSISVHEGAKNSLLVCRPIIHVEHYVNDLVCQGYRLF